MLSPPIHPEKGPADAAPAPRRQRIGLWAGTAAFLLLLLLPTLPGFTPPAQRTAAVAALMSIWWITEALPIPATALVPIVLFPALGVLPPAAATAPYGNTVIFLFLGGFLLALSMERWGLHRRLALAIVSLAGTRPPSLVLGFMLATAFLSMWISNTATAAMMVPIGMALAVLFRPADPGAPFPFGTALMLGIAYGATIGGVATIIGTPPNAVFAASAQELLGRPIGFLEWMYIGVPVAAVLLPVTWALLVYVLFPAGDLPEGAAAVLAEERRDLGPMKRGEKTTLTVFCLMAAAWILREPKHFSGFSIPGLSSLAPGIDDSTIAIGGALLLFLIPVDWRRGIYTLEWSATRRLPWGVLLLFGGGLSLAHAFEASGLTKVIAGAVGSLQGAPLWALLLLAVTIFVYLSELASNTAIAAMGMPLLAAGAAGLGQSPVVLMAAGALASSMAFMMPVATPPNAIVFGTGMVDIRQMFLAGIWLNLIAIGVVSTAAFLIAGPLLAR